MIESMVSKNYTARRIVAGVGLASAALFASGCGHEHPVITSGTVVAKTDTPPRDWIFMEPIPHTNCIPITSKYGTTEDCTTTFTYIPIPEHDDENWSLTLQACNLPNEPSGKCFTRNVGVSQLIYDATELGQHYSVPANN